MSVENWARRASGLLVPTMSFANPLGRWGVCPGEYGGEYGGEYACCGPGSPGSCEDCYTLGELPSSLWLDIPAPANDYCPSCSWYGQTYELSYSTTTDCYWRAGWVADEGSGPCAYSFGVKAHIGRSVDGDCVLSAGVDMYFYDDSHNEQHFSGASWRKTFNGLITGEINDTLSLYNFTLPSPDPPDQGFGDRLCDWSGVTEVDLYE